MPRKAKAKTQGVIVLPSRLDHAATEALRAEITAARGGAVALNADAVEFLGGAGVELLLAARAEWVSQAAEFSISCPSESFLHGLDRLGIAHSELLNESC